MLQDHTGKSFRLSATGETASVFFVGMVLALTACDKPDKSTPVSPGKDVGKTVSAAPGTSTIRPKCRTSRFIQCDKYQANIRIRVNGVQHYLAYSNTRSKGYPDYEAATLPDYGLAGWSYSVLHRYDAKQKILYKGDLTSRYISKTTSAGKHVKNGYGITDQSGRYLYIFDKAGLHRKTLDSMTGVVLYQFEYKNKQIQKIVIRGKVGVSFRRDGGGKLQSIQAGKGQPVAISIGDKGMIDSISPAKKVKHGFEYNDKGLLEKWRTPKGARYRYSYDSNGALTEEKRGRKVQRTVSRKHGQYSFETSVDYYGTVYRYKHRQISKRVSEITEKIADRELVKLELNDHRIVSVHKPTGDRYQYTYSADPRWGDALYYISGISHKKAGGGVAQYSLKREVRLQQPGNPFSLQQISDTVDEAGKKYQTIYTRDDNRVKYVSPMGKTRYMRFNTSGLPVEYHNNSGVLVYLEYDKNLQLKKLTAGKGKVARSFIIGRDKKTSAKTITDPLSRKFSYYFDSLGRISRIVLSGDKGTDFFRDKTGRLTGFKTPTGGEHKYRYDKYNRVISYIPPKLDGKSFRDKYRYYPNGRIKTVRRPGKVKISFKYNPGMQLRTVKLKRGSIRYQHDKASGRVTVIHGPYGVDIRAEYRGRYRSRETLSGKVKGSVGFTISDNLLQSIQVNKLPPVVYEYNRDRHITRVGQMMVKRERELGRVTETVLGNYRQVYKYNAHGEVLEKNVYNGSKLFFQERYSRDRAGRLLRKIVSVNGVEQTWAYEYNIGGALEAVQLNGKEVVRYQYDKNGNRTTVKQNGSEEKAGFDYHDRMLLQGKSVFQYADSGELQSKSLDGKSTQYVYDELGSLLSVELPGGKKIEYIIDGKNRRVGKKVNGKLVRTWLYLDNVRPVAEYNHADNSHSVFVYSGKNFTPDYLIKNNKTYVIISDHVGSPRFVVDIQSGKTVQEMEYSAFGEVTKNSSPGFQPFGFAGGLYDKDTRLVRFGVRDYSGAMGRFTTKDPVGLEGGDANFYAYVYNDPVNKVDPYGFWSCAPGSACYIGNVATAKAGPGQQSNGSADRQADSDDGNEIQETGLGVTSSAASVPSSDDQSRGGLQGSFGFGGGVELARTRTSYSETRKQRKLAVAKRQWFETAATNELPARSGSGQEKAAESTQSKGTTTSVMGKSTGIKLLSKLSTDNKHIARDIAYKIYLPASGGQSKRKEIKTSGSDKPHFELKAGKYIARAWLGLNIYQYKELTIKAGETVTHQFRFNPGYIKLGMRKAASGPVLKKDHAGAWYEIYEAEADPSTGKRKWVTQSGTTQPDWKIKPGKYLVMARYGRVWVKKELEIRAGQTTAHEFTMDAGDLKVKPVDGAGKVISASHKVYSKQSDGKWKFEFDTGASSWQKGLKAGRYKIVTRAWDLKKEFTHEVTVTAGETKELVINTSQAAKPTGADSKKTGAKGKLELAMRAAQGAPLKEYHLIKYLIYDLKKDKSGKYKLITRARGYTRSFSLKPGKYLTEAWYKKHKKTTVLEIKTGETTKYVFTMNVGWLKPRMRRAKGKKLWTYYGAWYYVYKAEKGPDGKLQQVTYSSLQNPVFALKPGKYLVKAKYGLVERTSEVVVKAGETTDFVFNMNMGAISVGMRKPGEKKFFTQYGIWYYLYSSEKDKSGKYRNLDYKPHQRYTWSLKPGKYIVEAKFNTFKERREIEVKAGETVDVVFILKQ